MKRARVIRSDPVEIVRKQIISGIRSTDISIAVSLRFIELCVHERAWSISNEVFRNVEKPMSEEEYHIYILRDRNIISVKS